MTRRGFSLIELLVAIALIIALLGALFAFSWDVLATRDQIIRVTSQQRAATVFIEHAERDLMSCIVGDRRAGAGIRGDNESLSILTRQVPAGRAGRSGAGSALADLERATYSFEGNRISVARSAPSSAQGSSAAEPMDASVAKVRIRYHDGTAWRDRFDSLEDGALPRAVEIAIWFDPWPGDALVDEVAEDDDSPDEGLFERSTFDTGGGFDEREAALRDDVGRDEPRPDRLRVIAIPDGGDDS